MRGTSALLCIKRINSHTSTSEELAAKYEGKLKKSYDNAVHILLEDLLPIITDRPITHAAKTYVSAHSQKAIKASYKANENFLFLLDKAALFIPKPPMFLPWNDISSAVVSRVGGLSTTTRTFEMKFNMKSGTEYAFANINREEFGPLSSFLASKGIKIKNEMDETGDVQYDVGESSDTDGEEAGPAARKRTFVDMQDGELLDSESEDEDFIADSSSGTSVSYLN